MRVHLRPPAHHSQAMYRVARALHAHAPAGVETVNDPTGADLTLIHAIGADAMTEPRGRDYAVIQYCLQSAGGDAAAWRAFWSGARAVWSYYDLRKLAGYDGGNFLHRPMGVDTRTFRWRASARPIAAFTSGYMSGPCGEAIEEMALACARSRVKVLHLGPADIQGWEGLKPFQWRNVHMITDDVLAEFYQLCRCVSGLRFVEGFEMPVLEGFACGARPIVFDRPEARRWFSGFAVFVPEAHGEGLIRSLCAALRAAEPVTEAERDAVIGQFEWAGLARDFWRRAA